MVSEYARNRQFADAQIPIVTTILRQNLGRIIKINVAEPEDDMQRATDMTIQVQGGAVAVRYRRGDCKYRDFTVRSYNNGLRTEIDKLRDGFGDWYLYCWDGDGGIDWMLVDLQLVRTAGLLEGRITKMNADGHTGFVVIPLMELNASDCIIGKGTYKGETSGI